MTEPIEAKYVFPLDEKAAVCGFEAFINGKHIIGMYIEVNIPFMFWLKAKKKMSFIGINTKKFYHLKPFFKHVSFNSYSSLKKLFTTDLKWYMFKSFTIGCGDF